MAVQVSSSVARTYTQATQDSTRTSSSDYVISGTKERYTLTHLSFYLLLRILAWVICFDNVKLPPSKRYLTAYMSAIEMNAAEIKVIKLH